MLTHKSNAHTSEGRNTHRSTQMHTNTLALSSRHFHLHMHPCAITLRYQNTFERHITMTCAWRWAWAKIKTSLGSWEECLDEQRHSSDEIISRDILSVTWMKAFLVLVTYQISYIWKCGFMISGRLPEVWLVDNHSVKWDLGMMLDISSFTNVQFIYIPAIQNVVLMMRLYLCVAANSITISSEVRGNHTESLCIMTPR